MVTAARNRSNELARALGTGLAVWTAMTRLTLHRFDDAFDRHVLIRDTRPMIELLSSPELRAIGEAERLAGQLASSPAARASEQVRRALLDLRCLLERLVPV